MTAMSDLGALTAAVERLGTEVRRRTNIVVALLLVGALTFSAFALVALQNRKAIGILRDATTPGGQIYERGQRRSATLVAGIGRCILERTPETCLPPTTTTVARGS